MSASLFKKLRVYLTGTPLAGCGETSRQLGRIYQPGFKPAAAAFADTGVWNVVVNFDGGKVPVAIRPKLRIARVYDPSDKEDQGRDPHVRDEARFLRQAQGVIYVVDSQVARLDANVAGVTELVGVLSRLGRDPAEVPVVFQLNKRDLSNIASESVLRQALRWSRSDCVCTVATKGQGIDRLVPTALQLIGRHK